MHSLFKNGIEKKVWKIDDLCLLYKNNGYILFENNLFKLLRVTVCSFFLATLDHTGLWAGSPGYVAFDDWPEFINLPANFGSFEENSEEVSNRGEQQAEPHFSKPVKNI